jgi:hypothetical protein
MRLSSARVELPVKKRKQDYECVIMNILILNLGFPTTRHAMCSLFVHFGLI